MCVPFLDLSRGSLHLYVFAGVKWAAMRGAPGGVIMSEFRNPQAGLGALLTPQDSVLLLIDHQAFQFANLHSHEPTLVVNNVVGLAKTAKVFWVPTILSTVLERG